MISAALSLLAAIAEATAKVVTESALKWLRSFARSPEHLLNVYPVNELDPARFVGNYAAGGFTDYFATVHDPEIGDALVSNEGVIICGRPGIGKSHSAVTQVQRYRDWYVIEPVRGALASPVLADAVKRLEPRSYILLLDDVNRFMSTAGPTGHHSVLDLADLIRARSNSFRVVATVRSTDPEFDVLNSEPNVLNRWKPILLSDWSDELGRTLSSRTGVPMSSWDGTPLSVKRPSSEYVLKYRQLGTQERLVLHVLIMLNAVGLSPISRDLLRLLCVHQAFGMSADSFDRAVANIYKTGFLKRADSEVAAYDAYLEQVRDWAPSSVHREALLDILATSGRSNELAVFASGEEREGRLDNAVRILRSAVAAAPRSGILYYRLGRLLLLLREVADAEQAFRRATELQPGDASAWYGLAEVLDTQGRDDEAGQCRRRCRAVSHKNPLIVRTRTADIIRQDGHLTGALEEFDSILQSAPNFLLALYGKARVLRELERWQEAKAVYESVIARSPDWAEAHFGLCGVLRGLGQVSDAERAVRQALRLKPSLRSAYLSLADILLNTGRPELAEDTLNQALVRFPDSAQVLTHLAEAYFRQKRRDDAEAACRKAIGVAPDHAEAHVGLARALRIAGKTEEAIDANRTALRLRPDFAEAYFGLAWCYADSKAWEMNITALRKAVELKPKFAEARYFLARALREAGSYEEALDEFEAAKNLGFNLGQVLYQMAKIHMSVNKPDVAINYLIQAVNAGSVDRERMRTATVFGPLLCDPRFQSLLHPNNDKT